MTARLGSVCTGMGGLDVAVGALLPVEHAWHAEVDPAASKVLAAHWPDVPNLGDLTAADWPTVAPVDVLAGGIPCQAFSLAGKRKGSADDRDLWPVRKHEPDGTARRGAVDAIRGLRPRLFVLENVPGLLSWDDGSAFAVILADLHELGYEVSWTTVGACLVGACHHRHRLFLAATTVTGCSSPPREPMARFEGGRWVPWADALFGDPGPVAWPPSGLVVNGRVWALPVDTCGATGTVLPTPVAHDTGRSPEAHLAMRSETGHASVCSLSVAVQMLPTPTARLGNEQRGAPSAELAAQRMESGRRNLEDAVALLPTPRASDTGTAGRRAGEGWRPPLSEVLLPTPRAAAQRTSRSAALARDSRSAPSLEQALEIAQGILPRELESWDEAPASWQPLPTPTARDASRGAGWGDQSGRPPSEVVALLPTPRASDAAKGGPNQRGSSGDLMLPAAVQPARFGAYEAAVRRQEQSFGLPAPDPTEPGRLGKPRLSPLFTEWMLGLPSGWITDHVGRHDAIRIAGNGVVAQAAAFALPTLPTFRAAVEALTVGQVAA